MRRELNGGPAAAGPADGHAGAIDLPHVQRRPLPAGVRTGRPRVLALFDKDWDDNTLDPLRAAGEIELAQCGFDLFSFPDNARLLSFDAWRFVDRICDRYAGQIDAVVSNNEQFGTLLAAVIAQRLGLPGNDPRSIIIAQHKLACRDVQRRIAPEAVPRFAPLGLALSDPRAHDKRTLQDVVLADDMTWPVFVKPIKAAFSVLARRVGSPDELARHLTFSRFERLVIRKLVQPFGDLSARLVPGLLDPTGMILESPVTGHQLNLDGYVHDGQVRFLGFVDEVMYPGEQAGARHFLRFEYPSRANEALRARVETLVRTLLAEIGFIHGFFNIEFFVRPDGRVVFVEINPRLASQFADFYRWVDGRDVHRMGVALGLGRDPAELPRSRPCAGAAASFIWRKFDGTSADRLPTRADRAWLAQQHPQSHLMMFAKSGVGLAREYKWLGSHRYAALNLGARDADEMRRRYESVCARLRWPSAW